ncbi:hypothetical protein IEO21_04397 [Rhodonia placenta]|uniref:Uncharacterized protein n=1 Tax=Rhodonia placenta TaxID=104341 RepID=A0A8H7P3S1_9APHY|nr:hypothetical protein IEO21_04397 [Postia placenta]
MLRRFRAAALGRRGESLPGCKPSNARRARRPGRCPLSISISPIPILAPPARRLPPCNSREYAAMPTSPFQQRRARGGPTRSPPAQAPIVPQWAERDKSGMAFPVRCRSLALVRTQAYISSSHPSTTAHRPIPSPSPGTQQSQALPTQKTPVPARLPISISPRTPVAVFTERKFTNSIQLDHIASHRARI